jgi:peptidoglycan/LPS O-acetylase OafA/YrhL
LSGRPGVCRWNGSSISSRRSCFCFLRKSYLHAVVTLVLMLVVGVVTRREMLSTLLVAFVVDPVPAVVRDRHRLPAGHGGPAQAQRRPVGEPAVRLLAIPSVLIKSRELLIWSLWMTFILAEDGRLGSSKVWHGLAQVLATNPVVRMLGRASYSTYLVHLPMFAIVGYA